MTETRKSHRVLRWADLLVPRVKPILKDVITGRL